jgi:membrane complex biogenesis BtpA family protein
MNRQFDPTVGKSKIGIGVVHLAPLPGSPGFEGDLPDVIDRAVEEAGLFREAGFGAVVAENYGDLPFFGGRVEPETVASMAVAAWEIRRKVGIPVGINVLRNDYEAALSVAGTCGCDFVRVNILVGTYVTPEGMIQGDPAMVLRLRHRVAPGVKIFADVLVKHARPIAATSIVGEALDVVERGRADGIVITGPRTGSPTSSEDLEAVRSGLEEAGMRVPILVGSGVNPSNLKRLLEIADGFIIGSYVRKGGLAGGAIEPARVSEIGSLLKEVSG